MSASVIFTNGFTAVKRMDIFLSSKDQTMWVLNAAEQYYIIDNISASV